MIPADTSCEPGPRGVQREYTRDLGVDTAAGRDTFFPSPSKATMLASPRRSKRLAGNSGGGFKGVKRHRRSLMLPTGRMLRAQLRLAERSRTSPGDEMSLPVVGTARSELRSAVFATESDDAVVPRCGGSGGSRHQDEMMTSGAPSSASSVISSAPVLAAAPKDAKRPCFHHQQHHQHHHLPQQEYHHCHPHHHQHQQQDQQQHHQHLSSGCQMSSSSSSLSSSSSSSSAETLIGRVPMASPRLINIPIHDDPRQWSRLDVRTWLDHVRRVYNIRDLDLDRFPMNGKALCIMSKDMFVYRVPHGGVPLYIDFQLRFRRALSIR